MNAKLVDIGAELREARQAQQRSLEELSHSTLIHIRHLTAIEEGRVEDLPEPIYVKHFIRKYANAVGLAGDELSHRYWNTQPLPPPPPASSSTIDLASWWIFPVLVGALMLGVVVTLAFVKARHSAETATLPEAAATSRPAQLASLAAPHAILASRSIAASLAPQPSHPLISAEAPLAIGASTSATSSPLVSESPLIVNGARIAFETRTVAASWMQIIADGREVHSDVVPAGKTIKWTALRSLVVRIGNPGSVYGTLGTRSLGLLGGKDSAAFRRTFLTAGAAAAAKAPDSGLRWHPNNLAPGAHASPAASRAALPAALHAASRSAAHPISETHARRSPAAAHTPHAAQPGKPADTGLSVPSAHLSATASPPAPDALPGADPASEPD